MSKKTDTEFEIFTKATKVIIYCNHTTNVFLAFFCILITNWVLHKFNYITTPHIYLWSVLIAILPYFLLSHALTWPSPRNNFQIAIAHVVKKFFLENIFKIFGLVAICLYFEIYGVIAITFFLYFLWVVKNMTIKEGQKHLNEYNNLKNIK